LAWVAGYMPGWYARPKTLLLGENRRVCVCVRERRIVSLRDC